MHFRSRRRLGAAAATAAVLLTAACGSDPSGEESSTSPSSSSGAATSSADGGEATGSNTIVVDGTTIEAPWKPACQRSEDGTKGAIDLLDLPSLEEIEESGEIDSTIVGADFDLDGDEATLTGFRVTNGSQEDLIADRFGDLVGNEDDMTITYSQEAVRVEGTAQGEVDGTERKDIPFVMDVGCTTWMGLTNEGDVAPPS
ncbi:hypothetical protein [Janibacter hoylei]|uniref:hypothetical protein n=1 Tax=Janibacter hoylei TaxID=364298 RepID=UPI0027B9C0AA|nr:hypothetical protein [Janibacter hoylei]